MGLSIDNERVTKQGTPVSRIWDEAWIATVEAVEAELERRVCGARTAVGQVCTFASNHSNGRCRFHGGHDRVGGQRGNRNTVLHGLYSRRLQVCGPDCAVFERCPMAGRDVAALPAAERPVCPYEQAEYNAAYTDNGYRLCQQGDVSSESSHLAHHLALLQVLTGRAATVLRDEPLTGRRRVRLKAGESSERQASSGNPIVQRDAQGNDVGVIRPNAAGGEASASEVKGESAVDAELRESAVRVSPALNAFLRLAAEYRRSLQTIRTAKEYRMTPEMAASLKKDRALDTELTPESMVEVFGGE